MPLARRTKSSAARVGTTSINKQPLIHDFGRIKKIVSVEPACNGGEKEHCIVKAESVISTAPTQLTATNGKKRKLATRIAIHEDNEGSEQSVHFKRSKAGCNEDDTTIVADELKTPYRRRRYQGSLPTPEGTPTEGIGHAQHVHDAPRDVHLVENAVQYTPLPLAQSGHPGAVDALHLPYELHDLIQLHSSLLRALSIHLGHNDRAAPIDVRVLTPSITKIWGRRRVTLEDIRRSLGVLEEPALRAMTVHSHMADYGLQLYQYDEEKICIEREYNNAPHSLMAHHLHEDSSNRTFTEGLRMAWMIWMADGKQTSQPASVAHFIEQLPLATVRRCPSPKIFKSSFAEGRRRLEELKDTGYEAQGLEMQEKENIKPYPRPPVKDRGDSLLQRMKAKGLLQATRPPVPSRKQSERRAALQRAEEIVSILAFSSATGRRQAYSLTMLVQMIQNSARSPMSREEVVNCLHLLAAELAQDFVTLVESGDIVGVVIDHSRKARGLDARIRSAANSF